MSKRILSLLVIALFFAVRSQAQTPAEMNTKFQSVVDSVVAVVGDWKEKMGELKEGSKHFEELKAMRVHLDALIDRETATVKKIKDAHESTRYRTAVINFLAYEKQMSSGAYAPFEKLTTAATDAQVKALADKIDDMMKKEDELKSEINSAQNEFAKENKITIDNAGE